MYFIHAHPSHFNMNNKDRLIINAAVQFIREGWVNPIEEVPVRFRFELSDNPSRKRVDGKLTFDYINRKKLEEIKELLKQGWVSDGDSFNNVDQMESYWNAAIEIVETEWTISDISQLFECE